MDWRVGSAVDRGAELRGAPGWLEAAWEHPEAVAVRVGIGSIEVDRDGLLVTRAVEGAFDAERHYLLGHLDQRPWFVTTDHGDDGLVPLRTVMDALPAVMLEVAFTGVGLATWHAGSRFCPACGGTTQVVRGGLARQCSTCGVEQFPRTDPAVIVAMVDPDDRLLLGRQPSWAPGRHSVFAGFVEMGESLEQAVHREMAEEVGLELTGVTYLGSQPWPFPRSLMVGFLARAGRAEPVAAEGEIEAARWFTREDLRRAMAVGEVGLPPFTSIARRMIEAWLDGVLPA